MSFLDLYQRDNEQTLAGARESAPRLPAEFGEAFGAAWNDGLLFRQSIAGQNARHAAMLDYVDDIERRTGRRLPSRREVADDSDYWTFVGKQVAQLRTEFPDLPEQPDAAALDQAAIARSRAARQGFIAMQQREKTGGGAFGSLLGSLLSGGADPVNIAALPVAAPVSAGYLGTALGWAAIGGVSQGVIEAAGGAFREQVQPGYAASGEPLLNIAEAAGGAAALGVGMKGLGAVWTRVKTGAWPRSIRDAGNIVESEANIQATNRFPGVEGEVAHRTALQESIENLVSGRPIDVERTVTPSVLAAYEERLAPVMDARARAVAAEESAVAIEREGARLPPTMERLSELVLADIRGSARAVETEAATARQGLAQEAASVQAARGPLTEQQQALVALRGDTERLRGEVAAAQERAAAARPAVDEATTARLAAIEEELRAPALSAARRADLLAERSSITETLARTAKGDERAAASLAQEQRGLEKALARQERRLAAAETAARRAEEKLAARTSRLPKRGEAIEARATSRAATVRNEMRRTIARLAQEGYGLRLTQDEAAALADRALSVSDEGLDAALREVTEDLVGRRVEAMRAEPELPGVIAPSSEIPGAEQRGRVLRGQRERAGYWTEEMRKGITALAREVGYEMPREEAASIAAALSGLPEHEALAVLDEVMLRPRTITQDLPGTLAASRRIRAAGAAVEEAPPPVPRETQDALAAEISPEAVAKLRADPELDETVLRDLDRLRVERGDIDIPVGETVGPAGERVVQSRKLEDVLAEADERLAAAREIEACVGPQQEAAE